MSSTGNTPPPPLPSSLSPDNTNTAPPTPAETENPISLLNHVVVALPDSGNLPEEELEDLKEEELEELAMILPKDGELNKITYYFTEEEILQQLESRLNQETVSTSHLPATASSSETPPSHGYRTRSKTGNLPKKNYRKEL